MSDVKPWTPWIWYPELWPTKSKFYTYLRGSIRKAVWNQSPIKIVFKNENCSKPPDGYCGRAKSGAYCALCGEWEGKSKLQVDHITGNAPLSDEEHILEFIKHMIPPPNSLQLVKPDAHKAKSYAEKQCISYEEAVISKKIIQIVKDKSDKDFLLDKGITPENSIAKRKLQLIKYFEENK